MAFSFQAAFTNSIPIGLEQLVENVVGPLNFLLFSNTGLFQQVGHNVTTSKLARCSEVDSDEFSKTGRVIIPGSFGITIGFKDRVSSHNLIFQRYFHLRFLSTSSSNHGKICDDLLGIFCLASTRLASNQHSVVLLILQHVAVSSLSNSPQMGWNFIPPLAKIDLAHPVSVNWVALVRVDNNHKKTRVSVDHLSLVTSLQIPEDRGIIEEGQVDHVLALLKLGRVDFSNKCTFEGELFVSNSNHTF